MASTYTVNIGIEKPGTGDQSGTWGNTTNTNFDIIDQATNGIATVTLAAAGTSGSPNTLLINNGALSDGRNRFIEFNDGADLGATAYVQLDPNDAEKIVHIRNSLSASRGLILFQGTYNASNDFIVPNGADVLVKFNGGGTGATVTDVNANLAVSQLSLIDGNKAVFGAGSDLQIYHDGTHSRIADAGTGDLKISTTGGAVRITANGVTDDMIVANQGGSVSLSHSGSTKLATTATGVDITGAISSNKGSAGTLATFTDGVNSNFVVETASLITTVGNTGGSTALAFKSSNTERMRIDSSGNVGIGITAPDAEPRLHVRKGDAGSVDSATNSVLTIENNTTAILQFLTPNTANQQIRFGDPQDTGIGFIQYNHTANAIQFGTNGPEKMRIDSGGNLLVGTTVLNYGTITGGIIRNDGLISAVRDGGNPANFQRKTSDGEIIQLGKDGTRVGSIGTISGGTYIGSGDTGLFFEPVSNEIRPFNTSTEASIDATIDLGRSASRFKDLYLSGGVRATGSLDLTVPETAGVAVQVEFGNNTNTTRRTVQFYKDNVQPAVADDGLIGLGVAAARFKDLYLSGNAYADNFIGTNDTDTFIAMTGSNLMRFYTNNAERMRITSASKVLVNTTSTSYGGQITARQTAGIALAAIAAVNSGTTGTRRLIDFFTGTSTTRKGSIESDGTNTSYNTSSDYRLKENVTADWDATTRLKQLNPVRFNFIENADKTVDGFLAHEVQTVVPEAISGTKDAMMDEEYEVSAATGDVYTPAIEAVLDEDGNEVTPAVAEVIHSTDVEHPEELTEGQQWRETTAAVMGTRSVPDYQGIDQSKLVPILTKALIEAVEKIEQLETRILALEAN